MPRLYARDALVHGLIPRLVGLAHDRMRTVPGEHPGDLPAVVVTGGHGSGKTAVLDKLAGYYEERVPFARADLAAPWARGSGDLTVSNSSAVLEALVRLVAGTGPSVHPFGRRHFGRLLPALFAVTSWHRGNAAEQEVARRRLTRLLVVIEEDRRPGEEEPQDAGTRWMADVAARLAAADGTSDLRPVAEAVVGQYFERHPGRREARTVQAWYQAHDEHADTGAEALVRLCRRFHRGGDYRRATERTLLAAFLEDLTDAHLARRRLTRAPRPLALLDNVHTEAGREVLDLLLEYRAEPGHRRPDPLVVVATRTDTGPDLYPHAVSRELHQLVDRSDWTRGDSGAPSAGLLTVGLPPLSRADLGEMLIDSSPALDPHLPTFVHDLTGGRPLAASVLSEAILNLPADRQVGVEDLLLLETADGRPVTARLLEDLVPQAQVRDQLVLLSVAETPGAAHALSEALRDAASPWSAAAAAQYLRDEGWQTDERSFIGDPLLRVLLIEELRRISGDEAAEHRWDEVHQVLREHYAGLGEEGEPGVLRHTLATGEAWSVVITLTDHFRGRDAARWLDCLRRAVTAPHPPSVNGWQDQRAETARGKLDGAHEGVGDLKRSVNRLLHAAWYVGDSIGDPPEDLCGTLERELDFLSLRHPTGYAVLSRAAREWPAAARERRPFPRPD